MSQEFIYILILASVVILALVVFIVVKRGNKVVKEEPKTKIESKPITLNVVNFDQRLKTGLGKSRQDIWQKIKGLVTGNNIDENLKEQLEEILYQADVPLSMVEKILKQASIVNGLEPILETIKKVMLTIFEPVQKNIEANRPLLEKIWQNDLSPVPTLQVIMVVGVNGVGKTTTVGKLAAGLSRSNKKVVVAAADTFRAAAKEQLQIWCNRAEAELIMGKDNNADPAAVCYQAVSKAIELKADFCLLDTAGRLHNNEQLMEELKKIKRVIKKLQPDAPQETLIVLDAMTGQNALKQAKQFQESLEGLTGVVLTKCDGSAKAGCALAIVEQLKVPIRFIGVGETLEDLDLFSTAQFVDAMLGNS